ncbi:MAG TPA: SRPBCC family protein [Acidimicrobiia bacterium]|nr:SRPBCC family protein [Acidimicrobiia bacterium]
MAISEVTVVIRRSPGDVFGVLSDVENTSKWYPKPVTERWTSEGPVGVGSTRRSEARAFGLRVKNDAEVTVFDRDQALGLKSISGAVPFDTIIRVNPVEEGSSVHWVTDLRPHGIFTVIVALTMRAHTRTTRQGLLNLKALMESGVL